MMPSKYTEGIDKLESCGGGDIVATSFERQPDIAERTCELKSEYLD